MIESDFQTILDAPRELDFRREHALEFLKARGFTNLKVATNGRDEVTVVFAELRDNKFLAINLIGQYACIGCEKCSHQLEWVKNKLRCLKCDPRETFTVRWVQEYLFAIEADSKEDAFKAIYDVSEEHLLQEFEPLHSFNTVEVVE